MSRVMTGKETGGIETNEQKRVNELKMEIFRFSYREEVNFIFDICRSMFHSVNRLH